MPLTGFAIAAGIGLAKNELIDKPAANRKRKLAAETTRYSPWTKLKGEMPDEPNALGTALQTGVTGAQIGAGYQANKSDTAFKDAMTARLNTGGSIGGGWGGGYGKDLSKGSLGGDAMGQKLNPWSTNPSYDPYTP